MKKLSQLLESINEIDSLLELDFKDKKAFQKYQSIHKMKPTTKVNIAGKDTTVGDEAGDDSQTPPEAPKKMTGKDVDNKAVANAKAQDDIEKDIMGDEPKGDTTADTLTKGLKDGGLNPYKDGPMINQALDDIGGDHSDLKKKIDTYGDNVPSSRGKSEAQYQKEVDKYKEEGEKLSNDIVDAISDKPKSDKAGTKAAVDSALKRFNSEVDLDSFEDNPDGFDSLQDIANDLEQTPIGQDPEFDKLYDDLMDNQDTESAENFKKYLDDQSKVDKPKSDEPVKLDNQGQAAVDSVDWNKYDGAREGAAAIRSKVYKDMDDNPDEWNAQINSLYDLFAGELEGQIPQEDLDNLAAANINDSELDDALLSKVPPAELSKKIQILADFHKKYSTIGKKQAGKSDKPTKDSKGRILPQAPNYDTKKKTTSKKPSSLDSYYAKEDAKEKWLSSNPDKTSYDWSRLPYGTMSDLISKEMKAKGFKENINLRELSKITTRYNK